MAITSSTRTLTNSGTQSPKKVGKVLNDLLAIAKYNSSKEAISAAGAVSTAVYHTTLAITGTTAYTMGAPTFAGQRKLITQLSGASTPAGTVTVTGMRIAGQDAFTTFNQLTAALVSAPRSLELVSSDGLTWDIAAMVGVTVA